MAKLNVLEHLATEFEKLAETPLPDPSRPTPLYVSRSHFADWASWLRDYMREQANCQAEDKGKNTIRFRIDRVKVVSGEILDDDGQPTGEFCDVVDDSGILLDCELQGKCGVAAEVKFNDSEAAHLTLFSREC